MMIIGKIWRFWGRVLWILAAGFAAPALGAATPAFGQAPHVLLILADDLGWGDAGFNGRREWTTPHLDQLAARGLIMERMYAAATVCAPSRAALLTGKSTIHCGVSRNDQDLPLSETTLAEALGERGYVSGYFGKWHQGKPHNVRGDLKAGHPLDQGFAEFFGYLDAVAAWEKFPKTLYQGRASIPVQGYADDLFTDRALTFIKNRHRLAPDQPWFAQVSLTATHFHINAPPESVAEFRGRLPEPEPGRDLSAAYAGMVRRMDDNVGRLTALLEELGLMSRTLIVFTGDNGATFESGNRGVSNALDSNAPFRGQKRTLYEGGIRVPGLAVWEGVLPAGRRITTPIHMTDLFPTVLAAAGGTPKPAWKIDGVNQRSLWMRRDDPPVSLSQDQDRTLFWEWRSEGSNLKAALCGPYKLILIDDRTRELYNVVADPAERRNLAASRPEMVQRLEASLRAWLATETVQPRP